MGHADPFRPDLRYPEIGDGRIVYMIGYTKSVAKRGPGFGIQACAVIVLWFGATGTIVWLMVHG